MTATVPDPATWSALVAIAVLLFASAAMSASEVALFSLGATDLRDLKERGGTSGQRVLDLLARPRRLLATILVWNNFVNVGIVILSSIALSGLVDLDRMPDHLVFILQVVVVTAVLLLVGEVVPKVYATTHALRVAQRMAGPLLVLRWIATPVNEALIRSTSFIEKRYKKRTQNISVDALGHALDLTNDASTTAEEQRILRGIVKFGNIEVRQIMRPRMEVTAFNKELSFADLLPAIIDSGYSRVPVYEETMDRVVGVLHIKDVLPHMDSPGFDWHTLLRDPYFVPEGKKLDDLLTEFQEKKVHLAVVVDEYGGTSGIVTLEDVIEEIVGDITDEFDDEDLIYSKLDDHTWVFEGRVALNDLYRVMGIEGKLFEDHKGESETLGGFVLELTGRIPRKGERVDLHQYTFVVEASDNKRIRRVKVIVKDGGQG
ncbi:MAG TPA: gliding motility-associated protein GldE [Flavobacteriales bacterium]|nr:gliding motility-associated protein GldE [Flavobacteriales bacterium]HOP44419.1 gliding motility-associated protein GldE [Flavobacteriales bacterium]HPF68179.1 gliding motility-associated protein GldE [Flavobacteriales bacterium]HPJ52473.1 gliding motility-associated protein GldE [Flavobacteriales bacterium]HPQ59551.1 gliding motility-associated protein GldE [Flavobacteriales bacterium]